MSDSAKPPADEREREPSTGGAGDDAPEGDRRRLFERAVPEVLRKLLERAVETGVETITEGPENIRKHLGDLKLPKEAAHYVYEQIDDTKKGLYRVVAKEIRDVLEHMSFADEIATVLTKLSFEINTQIRFVPNQSSKEAWAAKDAEANEGEPAGQAAGGTANAAASSPPPEGQRQRKFPRPRVVSKVVMKAVDMVTATVSAGTPRFRGEGGAPTPPRTPAGGNKADPEAKD